MKTPHKNTKLTPEILEQVDVVITGSLLFVGFLCTAALCIIDDFHLKIHPDILVYVALGCILLCILQHLVMIFVGIYAEHRKKEEQEAKSQHVTREEEK